MTDGMREPTISELLNVVTDLAEAVVNLAVVNNATVLGMDNDAREHAAQYLTAIGSVTRKLQALQEPPSHD